MITRFSFLVRSILMRIFKWCRRICAGKTFVAALVVGVPVATGNCAEEFAYAAVGAAPELEQAKERGAREASGRTANEENRRKIRKESDVKSKTREQYYPQQAALLAKGYKETARIVARNGGDPQPLLDAAAYFESHSN
jgi:hypothetical protein